MNELKPIPAKVFAWGARIALWPARVAAARAAFGQLAAMDARGLADIGLTAARSAQCDGVGALDADPTRSSRRARSRLEPALERRRPLDLVDRRRERAREPARDERAPRRDFGFGARPRRRRDICGDPADNSACRGEPQPAIPHSGAGGDRRRRRRFPCSRRAGGRRPGETFPYSRLAAVCLAAGFPASRPWRSYAARPRTPESSSGRCRSPRSSPRR